MVKRRMAEPDPITVDITRCELDGIAPADRGRYRERRGISN